MIEPNVATLETLYLCNFIHILLSCLLQSFCKIYYQLKEIFTNIEIKKKTNSKILIYFLFLSIIAIINPTINVKMPTIIIIAPIIAPLKKLKLTWLF